MSASDDELAEVERAYRKVRWSLLFNFGFVVVGCLVATGVRQSVGLPPTMLGAVLIVALLVFGGDIMKFIRCRDRLRQLRNEHHSH